MGRTSAPFCGGQSAVATSLILKFTQNLLHGEEHISSGNAFRGKNIRLVIRDQRTWCKRLGTQGVLVLAGWGPANIGRTKESDARGSEQCGKVSGSGVVAHHHGSTLNGCECGLETGLTNHFGLGDVFGDPLETFFFIRSAQENDGMASGLKFLSQCDEA